MSDGIPTRPTSRQDFKIAIICALTLEAEMVETILDKDWADDGVKYGKAVGDMNTYTTGIIAQQNVVLAYCHAMGNNSAAQVATGLRSSFTGIKIAFVVGICGASPFTNSHEEIVLGDCIISTAVVQFDLGRRGPNGFQMRDGLSGGVLSVEIGALLAKLQTRKNRQRLTKNLNTYLRTLQTEDPRTIYPGIEADRLYEPSYRHTHHEYKEACRECNVKTGICGKSCVVLECKEEHLISRVRLMSDTISSNVVLPIIHFGRFGSSNTVLKSGAERDAIIQANNNNIIAFEMEGSGVWDVHPTIVIKSACDYADSHKNKIWQAYAAGVSAAALKSFLLELEFPDDEARSIAASYDVKSGHSSNNDATESKMSQNYGVQAQVVHGDIHYYNYQSTAALQRSQLDTTAVREALHAADGAIQRYYNSSDRLKIRRLSGETLPLDKCYINLALVLGDNNNNNNKKQTESEKQSFNLGTRLKLKASSIGQPVALADLFKSRKSSNGIVMEPRRIFIQGRAGVGKTTLCKKIVHEFMERQLGDAGGLFDRLLWLPLRKLKNTSRRYMWRDLLQDAYWPPPQVRDWDDLTTVISEELASSAEYRSKTLFLLDGLDEISRQWSPEDGIYQFVQTLICDAPNIILTSRPQASSLNLGTFDLELETTGFILEQINTYIDHCITDNHTKSKMKDFIKTRPLLQDLLRIPVQLDAFCCTWSSEVFDENNLRKLALTDIVSTMTTLYVAISTELCRKDLERTKRHSQPHTLGASDVHMLLAEELRLLEEFAFQGLINGIKDFRPGHQESIGLLLKQTRATSSFSYSSAIEELSFLRTSDVTEHRNKRNYHFLHSTFQEFFAAKHFVRHWRSNTPLIRLDLTCIPGTVDENLPSIPPTRFLQAEKYNPEYNIFWRFVTGLVQIQPEQQTDRFKLFRTSKTVRTLFDELNNEPRDLLAAAHHRLMMYCLSELMPSKRQEIQELRTNEEDVLREWILKEFKATSRFILGEQAEFPERILRSLLKSDTSAFHTTAALYALEDRAYISKETLDSIYTLMDDESAVKFHRQALKWALSSTKPGSNEMLVGTILGSCAGSNGEVSMQRPADITQARRTSLPLTVISTLVAILKNGDRGEREFALDVLKKQTVLPSEAITTMFSTIIRTKSQHIRRSVTDILGKQCLREEIIETLIVALQNKDSNIRLAMVDILVEQVPLPEGSIMGLITILEGNKDPEVRQSAISIIKRHSSLSKGAIMVLISVFKENEDENVQRSAMAILGSQSSLPEEAIAVLITTIEEHKDSDTQELAADGLVRQPSLSAEIIAPLVTILKHNSRFGERNFIADVLGKGSFHPEKVISMLAIVLLDEDASVRSVAADILGKQLSNFSELSSQGALTGLVAALQDTVLDVRESAIKALGRQPSLPENIVIILIEMLYGEYSDMRIGAADVLGQQSSLPPKAIIQLIKLFEKKFRADQNLIKDILGKQSSLPMEAITVLIDLLHNEDPSIRFAAMDILQKQSFLPIKAISALVLMLKDERIRRSTLDALATQSCLPEEAIHAITAILRDRNDDRLVRTVAANTLGTQSPLSHVAITTLTAMLQDEDEDVRIASAETLARQPSLPQDSVTDLTTMLKNQNWVERCSAAKALGKQLSPLPQETIMSLIATLQDMRLDVRKNAVDTLGKQCLPQMAIARLVAMLQDESMYVQRAAMDLLGRQHIPDELLPAIVVGLKSRDELARIFAAETLSKQTSTSQVTIGALVAGLEDKDGSVRRFIVQALGKHAYLPEAAINALITRLTDSRLDVQSAAAKVLKDQAHLSREAMIAVIAIFDTNGYFLYDIIHKHDIYSHISEFDDVTWRRLFAYWIEQSFECPVHCYEYSGSLLVHIRGREYVISQDPVRTQSLVQAISPLVDKALVTSTSKRSPWSWT